MKSFSFILRFSRAPDESLLRKFLKQYLNKQKKKSSFVLSGILRSEYFDVLFVFSEFAGCNTPTIRKELIEMPTFADLVLDCIKKEIDVLKFYKTFDFAPAVDTVLFKSEDI